MKRVFLTTAFALLMVGLVGQPAYVKPITEGKPQPRVLSIADGFSPAMEVRPGQPSAADAIETDIGTTMYDLQSNSCSPYGRLYVYPDGTRGGIWAMGKAPTAYSDRGTGYNYFNGSAWGVDPPNRIETVRTGWPSYAPCGSNGEIVIAHQGGTQPLIISKRTTKGTGAWVQTYLNAPSGATGLLWPRMITSGTNNNTVHVIALTAPTANGGTVYQGLDGALIYCRSVDGGQTFGAWSILPGLTSVQYLKFDGDTYNWLIPHGDKIGFVISDSDKDLILMKSLDNGSSWQKVVVWQHPYPFYSPTMVTDEYFCPDGAAHGAFDAVGRIHLAFGVNKSYSDGGGSYWFPWVDGLAYWNSDMPAWLGGSLTALDPDNLFASGNLIGWMQDINGNGQLDLVSISGGYAIYYLSPTSMPQLVIDHISNTIYCVYSSITETFNNGTQDYRHIWSRASSNNGLTWTDPIDHTNSIFHVFDECVFPSISPTLESGLPAIIYQRDVEPGMSIRGDLDPPTTNTITYMKLDEYLGSGVANPSGFVATPVSSSQINLNWVLNANNNNVMLAWSSTSTFGVPANGTSYPAGSSIPGGGYVLYNGGGTSFSHTGLSPLTPYFYKIFSYNASNAYSGGSQANATTPGNLLTVAPSNHNVTAASGAVNFSINCSGSWNASSNQTWCTVTPSGTGNSTLVATYSANTSITPRVATITVTASGANPVNVTVTQDGATVILTVTPSNQNVTASAGSTSFTVNSNSNWNCTSNASWCLVTTSGSGNAVIIANYTENTSTASRVATLTVSASGAPNVYVTVTQAGAAPYLSVIPPNQNVGSPAGSTSFNVSSNTSWTASSNQTWCTVTPSGSGNNVIIATYTENTSTTQRIAQITVIASGVAPVVVTVTQAGVGAPYLSVTPPNQNVSSQAGNTSFSVSSNIAWTASSNQTWCVVTPSGTGNGTISATYTGNLTTQVRIATITVSGSGVSNAVVTVTQEGAIPYLNVSPASQTVNYQSGKTYYNIQSNTDWVAWSTETWCNPTPSGSGNFSLETVYEANTLPIDRQTNIIILAGGVPPQMVELKQLPFIVGVDSQQKNLLLFPNPCKGRFTVSRQSAENFNAWIEVFSPTGIMLVREFYSHGSTYFVDIPNAAKGIYFVRVLEGSETTTWKIVVE